MVGRPKIDLNEKVKQLLTHTSESDHSSLAPITNFEQRVNACFGLIKYVDDHIDHPSANIYQAPYSRHKSLLHRMTLVSIIEAFERYLKELAVVCVDAVAAYVIDDRFDKFRPTGGNLASQYGSGSVGRVMCESDTWLTNSTINERFGQVLKSHFEKSWEHLFPDDKQQPAIERDRALTLAILWQIRHSITHNTGVLTHSDARRFELMIKSNVKAEEIIDPSVKDLHYAKRFLSETAMHTNQRVADRLAIVLTERFQDDSSIFIPQEIADKLATRFQRKITIAGSVGNP